jgi:O-antigen ligase
MRRGAGTLAALLLVIALVLAVFHGGGSSDGSLVPIAVLSLLGAAALAAGAAVGVGERPGLGAPAVGLLVAFAAYVAWCGLSIVWSIAPDRSWDYVNRGLAYLALLAVGMVAGSLVRDAPRLLAAALTVLVGAALVWALAGKVVPALGPDASRSARLLEPVGYWNALALLLAMGLPLWSWLAGEALRPAVRALAAAAVAASVVALALTGSRGGLIVAAVAVAAWLALAPRRLEGAGALALGVPVGGVVGAWALTQPGVADEGVSRATQRSDGALFGVVLLVALAVVYAAGLLLARRPPLEPEERQRTGRLVALGAAVAFVLVVVGGMVRVGHPGAWAGHRLDEFRNPPSQSVPENAGQRLGSFSSNNRWTWWKESWHIWRDDPLGGAGAGSFELARRPLREDTQVPLAPHDLPLQALAETGLVGFMLLLAAAASAGWAVAAGLGRLGGPSRAAGGALSAALVAWAAHSLIDMSWQYVAVSAPFFAALGVLATARGEPVAARRRAPIAAAAAVAFGLAAVASVGLPWLADRRLGDAVDAFAAGDLAAAATDARQAQRLNPLDIAPVQMHASIDEARGRFDDAEGLYVDAVDLQPENPDTWFELGRFEFRVRKRPQVAYCYFDRAYALDSWDDDTARALNEVRQAGATGTPCRTTARG